MSEAEDRVRAGYEWFNSDDGRIPNLDWWHEDAVWATAREDPDSETRYGLEAVIAQFQTWTEAYPDLRVEPQEVREGEHAVFAWVRFVGHGAGSGAPMQMELSHIWWVEDGRFKRCEEYFDRAEGLAAAGLME